MIIVKDGVAWVRDGSGIEHSASHGEAAAEIERLRAAIADHRDSVVNRVITINQIRDKALQAARLLADARDAGRSNVTDDAALIAVHMAELARLNDDEIVAVRDAVTAARPPVVPAII